MKNKHKFALIWIFWLFIASFKIYAAGPTPGTYSYRADTRAPNEIFKTGFQTWATTRGVEENNDIITYLLGGSVQHEDLDSLNAGWVSVAGDIFGALNYLNTEVVRHEEPPPLDRQQFWVYQIAPTSDGYSVNWMLQNYLQERGDTLINYQRVRVASLLTTYSHENEWIVRGGIPLSHIEGASLFQYDHDRNEFIQVHGSMISNPHYIAPPRPEPQTINPMLNENVPNTIYGYYDPNQPTPSASLGGLLPIASSCAGSGASGVGFAFLKSILPSIPQAPGCNYKVEAIKKINLDNVPTIPTKLIFKIGSINLCLKPENIVSASLVSTRSFALFSNCESGGHVLQAYYDQASRIVFPSDGYNMEVCLTAPENVISGREDWDWVLLWPCDINNIYQKWIITKGALHPFSNNKLKLQKSSRFAIISKKNEYKDISIDKQYMANNFFNVQSKSASEMFEIGLSYNYKNKKYYPRPPIGLWSSYYEYRTYYDVRNKRIIMLTYYSRGGIAPQGWRYSCLVSRQSGTTQPWNWAGWETCDIHPINVYDYQKWELVHPSSGNIQKQNQFYDIDGNRLYVDSNGLSSYFGQFFTQRPDGTEAGIKYFDLNRMYNVCENKAKNGWEECKATAKHSSMENDGRLFTVSQPSSPQENGYCQILSSNGKWMNHNKNRHDCESLNYRCNSGGSCYRWNKSPLEGYCQYLTSNNKWVNILFYSKEKCETLNKCSTGGGCYRWFTKH